MKKVFLGLAVLLLLTFFLSGCPMLAPDFETGYNQLYAIYEKYGVTNGMIVPTDLDELEALEADLTAFREQIAGAQTRDTAALIMLVEARLDLIEMQKNLIKSQERFATFTEIIVCNEIFLEGKDYFENATKKAKLALNKVKLFNDTFPLYKSMVEDREKVDLEAAIQAHLDNAEELEKSLNEIC